MRCIPHGTNGHEFALLVELGGIFCNGSLVAAQWECSPAGLTRRHAHYPRKWADWVAVEAIRSRTSQYGADCVRNEGGKFYRIGNRECGIGNGDPFPVPSHSPFPIPHSLFLMLHAWSSARYTVPLPPGHRFPIEKYALLRDRVIAECLVMPENLHDPERVRTADLELVHTADYVNRFTHGLLSGRGIRRSGFPWSPALAEDRSGRGGTLRRKT